jgi:hypothetical protein
MSPIGLDPHLLRRSLLYLLITALSIASTVTCAQIFETVGKVRMCVARIQVVSFKSVGRQWFSIIINGRVFPVTA